MSPISRARAELLEVASLGRKLLEAQSRRATRKDALDQALLRAEREREGLDQEIRCIAGLEAQLLEASRKLAAIVHTAHEAAQEPSPDSANA